MDTQAHLPSWHTCTHYGYAQGQLQPEHHLHTDREETAGSWEETREALAAHYWATELTTPLCAADISEALGEMDETQHLELAEAHAEADDAVLGRCIKRIVNTYWENWCLARADTTLAALRTR